MPKWDKCTIDMVDDIRHEVINDEDGESIKFHPCGVQSWHPMDVENKFCAFCGRYVPKEKT